jgi:hypothetical protein
VTQKKTVQKKVVQVTPKPAPIPAPVKKPVVAQKPVAKPDPAPPLVMEKKQPAATTAAPAAPSKPQKYVRRKQFKYQGQLIYEWEQTIDEVYIYVFPPPDMPGSALDVKISSSALAVGVKGNPPFISEDFPHEINGEGSLWTFTDGELEIQLLKSLVGVTWASALKGHGELDANEQQQVQQKLLLERFTKENPGFDFSQAQFNGDAPNPRDFMGGLNPTMYS